MSNDVEVGYALCVQRYLYLQYLSLFGLGITIISFSFLFLTSFQLRHAFHPFFSFYLIFLIFLYNFVMYIQLMIRLLHINFYEGIFDEILVTIHNFAYFLICPINLLCVIERIFATIISRYEHQRNYPFFVGSIFLALSLAGLLTYGEFVAEYVVDCTLLVQTFLSFVCITILYFINRNRTKKLTKRGGATLTLRYQMVENIKASRVLIPFLLMANIQTWVDQFFDVIGHVDFLQPEIYCSESDKTNGYLILTIARNILCALQPVIIIHFHELFRRKCLRLFRKQSGRNSGRIAAKKTQPTTGITKLTNVLGSEIILSITQNEYHEMMRNYWH